MEESEENKEESEEEKQTKENEDAEEIKLRSSEVSKKIKKNPWIIVSAVLAVIIIILLILLFKGGITGGVITEGDAASTLVDYLNARAGGGVSFVSSEDIGNLYKITVSYQGDKIPVYITKDGKYFVQGALPITAQATQPTQQQPQEILKSDKPKVELFIMTHCPYGLQAEKGLIPVLETLGGKIDGTIRFVHYFMHGDEEEQETYRQGCIREEQKDKWLSYLKCFLEDGDSDRCLTKTGVNKAKLDSCMTSKAKDYYDSDSELSQEYGVKGSPTLVINGQQVSSGRDSASFISTICSAFNKQPAECSEKLSSENPSPGFGYSASGGSSSSGGSCG